MNIRMLARLQDQKLPRYTSYPTAPHFSASVDASTYSRWLGELTTDSNASLYLHIPFCAELCRFCGCHTTVVNRYTPIAAYVDMLVREIRLVAERIPVRPRVTQIHFGGGSPNMLRGSDFRRIIEVVKERFDAMVEAEVAVELDPRTVTPAHVGTLAEAGATRISLGVQSFDRDVQNAIGRTQSWEEVKRVVEWFRHAGVEHINIDLMYGLPLQTTANVLDTVSRTLDLNPARIALFGYAHVPWMKKHQSLINAADLPDAVERLSQFEAGSRAIISAGYVPIGLDHFAVPDDSLALALRRGTLRRNFQGYSADTADVLLGFGASAISSLPQGYVQNITSTNQYLTKLTERALPVARGLELSPDDRLRRDIIERVMCDMAVNLDDVCVQHGADVSTFAPELRAVDELVGCGLGRRMGNAIAVNDSARAYLRAFGAIFDAHLTDSATLHSQAV